MPWKPELQPRARALESELAPVALNELATAVAAELLLRADALIGGIERYRHHPYRRSLAEPATLWREGTTRLVDYGPPEGRPVLVVPSLINRAYVLDLAEGRSLMRFLAMRGLRPLMVEWDRPGEAERGFDLSAYIAGRLDRAFEAAVEVAGAPIAVLGYCMGGLLALALAIRRRRRVSRLALLATPWDFHTGRLSYSRFVGALAEPSKAIFGPLGQIPTDMLQHLFFIADPHLAVRKFSRFAGLDPDSAEAVNFVATEDWLNDGVPLALPVASECFAGWYGANTPAEGRWRVAGIPVDPAEAEMPTLVIVPSRDKLVPPVSALALATRLKHAEVMRPDLGHIGMIVGRAAPQAVWAPLAEWLAA
jgi:polyhydroxyalkanoate synthase